jgi:hypothetical protein
MNVAAVNDQIVRRLSRRSLAGVKRDHVVNVLPLGHAEFDADEPEMMGALIRIHHRAGIRADQFGHNLALGRGDARPRRRQIRVRRRRADNDPTRTALVGQPEIAGEGRARLKHDHVARLRPVNRRLDVAARRDIDCLTSRRHVSRIQKNPWRFRLARRERRRARWVHSGFDPPGDGRPGATLHGAEETNRQYSERHQHDYFGPFHHHLSSHV